MFQIIKIVLMIPKMYGCQVKFQKCKSQSNIRNLSKVRISFIKNLYVPNYKDCSYDSKNIWLLGKIPKKYKSQSNFRNYTKVGIKVLKSKCCKLYLMVNFLEKLSDKFPKFTKKRSLTLPGNLPKMEPQLNSESIFWIC